MDKLSAFFDWLKQPPTLKGLVIVAGLAGFQIDPEKANTIILAASGLYAALALFYDNSTRKVKVPSPEELNKLLTSEEILALIKLRKEKIAADKVIKKVDNAK